MYTTYNREVLNNLESSTKYTEYLKTLSQGDIRGGGNYFDDGGGGGGRSKTRSQRRNRHNNLPGSTPLLPISDNEVKFANIFSPNESNALKLHLLQKTSSLPLLDHSDSSHARDGGSNSGAFGDDDDGSVVGDHDDPRLLHRRRSTAIGLLHDTRNINNNATSRHKGDSVANILYSTIRHGAAANNNGNNDYDNPSADETLHTGSDSKVDYDPHEPLAAVDQIALRHELLNNIRAISRATYFEDLYTGKVRRNSGSPEAEILRLLENPNAPVSHHHINPEDSLGERTIPSKDVSLSRVDRWIKESSEASSQATDDDKDAQHVSLYHQSVWNEEDGLGIKKPKGKNLVGVGDGTSDETTESDLETPSARVRRTTKYQQNSKPITNIPLTEYESGLNNNKHFSRNTDRTVVSRSMGKPVIPAGIIESSASYLQAKYLNDSKPNIYNKKGRLLAIDTTSQHGPRPPFSFGFNGSTDDLVPLSVSLPNVAQNTSNSYRSTPVAMHALQKHSVSRPENLNQSMANLSMSTGASTTKNTYKTRLDKRKLNAASNEQVGRRTMAQNQQKSFHHPAAAASKGKAMRVGRASDRGVPGLYTRLNMNQWVVKKVCFYVNGDDLHPRFEYRFRPGKDIRDLNQLLDMLTKKFPTLPLGARFIFTMDGYLINSLEELLNENSYLVSSTRKFKVRHGAVFARLPEVHHCLTSSHRIIAVVREHINFGIAPHQFLLTNFMKIKSRFYRFGSNLLTQSSTDIIHKLHFELAIKHGKEVREGENLGSNGIFPEIRGAKKGGVQKGHEALSRQFSTSDGNLYRSKRNATNPPGQIVANQKSINSLNSKSVSDVPRLVAHVIEEASSTAALLHQNSLMAREPIRVINGTKPSLQSQVLLNTKTSQPFEDLVRDLALSVRVPKQPIGNCLKTLAGRQIRSYSQLRSELKAGQRAFFIYSENRPAVAASTLKPKENTTTKHLNRNGKPIVKATLGKVNSNSSSDLSMVTSEGRMKDTKRKSQQPRRRSHSPASSLRTDSRQTNSRSPSPYHLKP